MKAYPRIHSLSTIGLRQHQEFDYEFHPFRTDFVGDSGCGKSMIADLLQLIFVGSKAFQSPTKSNEKREPKGMVLPASQSSGTGVGHAFLNIERTQGVYIVFGIHLRETDNSVEHFIIQESYNLDEIKSFSKPLCVADLVVNERVPNPTDFSALVEKYSLVYKAVPLKKFHQWLFDTKLLTMNLSTDKALSDYAAIIQAFSRGQGLDLNKSDSLKNFLFGPEKAAELLAKFNQAVRDMEAATQEYGKNQVEIDEITQKWKEIHQLGEHKDNYEKAQRVWAEAESADAIQRENDKRQHLQNLVTGIHNSLNNLEAYGKNMGEWLQMAPQVAIDLEEKSKAATETYSAAQTQHATLQKAQKAFRDLNEDADALRKQYQLNRTSIAHENHFLQLKQALAEKVLFSLFEKAAMTEKDFPLLLKELETLLAGKRGELENQQALSQFATIGAKGTFGNWAVNEGKSLSKEAESVLMHLKDRPLVRPVSPDVGQQVIIQPNALFQNFAPDIDNNNIGFWLSLNMLEEFIGYTEKELFSEEGIKTLEGQLTDLAKVSKEAIVELKIEVDNLEKLCSVLLGLPVAGAAALEAYRYFEIDKQPQPDKQLNIPEEQFEDYLGAIKNAAIITEHFKGAEQAMKDAITAESMFDTNQNKFKEMSDDILGILEQNKWTDRIHSIAQEVRLEFYNDTTAIALQTAKEAHYTNDPVFFYKEKIREARDMQKHLEMEQAHADYKKAVEARKEKDAEYERIFGVKFDFLSLGEDYISDVAKERIQYTEASTVYQTNFDLIVKRHVTDQYKFQSTKDYEELCVAVLPHILGKSRPAGLSDIEAFTRYSNNINETNRLFNELKLQTIKNLLDAVTGEVVTRRSEARSIDTFLNKEEREITGGHRVRLEQVPSRQYPVKWIEEYGDRMPGAGNLFTVQEGTANTLTKAGVSLEEKMLEAFRQLGGNLAGKATIAKLLDPNSYFDLIFSIQSQANEKSKGSTGQTYTALALLCIARLSRVSQGAQVGKNLGLRFMPIDEAEGLGTNYDMLYKVAKDYDYQIISMSISPLGLAAGEGRLLYGLHRNQESGEDINYIPMFYSEIGKHED